MAVTVALVAVAVVGLDQLTKWWALEALADGPVELIGSLRLNLVFNRAGAFGLGGGLVPFMALGALALVVVLLVRGGGTQGPAALLSSGLLVGGAVGNLIDRLVRSPGLFKGAVVDFVDLGFWPVFNLADTAITIGCVMLVLWGWRPAETTIEAGAANPSPADPSPADPSPADPSPADPNPASGSR